MAEQLATDKAKAAATILQRSVCLLLSCGALGNSRRVGLDDIEMTRPKVGGAQGEKEVITADQRQLAMQKRLLDSSVLSKPKHVLDMAKNYLRSVATSGHRVFGVGTYLIPSVMVPEVEGRLKMFVADLDAAKREFVTAYPKEVEKRREALGQLFNPGDYPLAEEAAAAFQLNWNYVSFDAPDNLEHIDRAIYDAAKAKHEGRLATAYDEVEAGLMAGALEVMKELQERLTPKPDGTTKALRSTALRDLQEFLRTLPFRNITDNDKLVGVMEAVQKATSGINVDDVRGSKHVREQLLAAATKAVEQLDGLIDESGNRAISFGSGKFGA